VRALVTGAGGLVGAHLVRHLESEGDEVVPLERTADGIDVADATRSPMRSSRPAGRHPGVRRRQHRPPAGHRVWEPTIPLDRTLSDVLADWWARLGADSLAHSREETRS
jgi:hypothetical protein